MVLFPKLYFIIKLYDFNNTLFVLGRIGSKATVYTMYCLTCLDGYGINQASRVANCQLVYLHLN